MVMAALLPRSVRRGVWRLPDPDWAVAALHAEPRCTACYRDRKELMPDPHQVLIVGAGPTGLVLALWLTKLGVGVASSTRPPSPEPPRAPWPCRRERWSCTASSTWPRRSSRTATGRRPSTLGGRRRRPARGFENRRGPHALSLHADLPAGRTRAAADRAAAGPGRRSSGGRTDGFEDGPTGPARLRAAGRRAKRPATRPISPAATEPARRCARRSGGFPGGTYATCSTSPTSKPRARRSTASCTSISTKPTSWPSFRSARAACA